MAALRSERAAVLTEALKQAEAEHKAGMGTFANVQQCQLALPRAQMEAAATPEGRIAVLKASIEHAREIERDTLARLKAGVGMPLDCAEAKAGRLRLEIDLALEQAKAQARP